VIDNCSYIAVGRVFAFGDLDLPFNHDMRDI